MLPDDKTDSLDHLLKVDVENLLRMVINSDPKRNNHGHLPKMVTTSKGLICTWLVSSFCERITQWLIN